MGLRQLICSSKPLRGSSYPLIFHFKLGSFLKRDATGIPTTERNTMKSTLQKKMVEDLQLRGYAERTQKSYARSVRQLENYWHLPAEENGRGLLEAD